MRNSEQLIILALRQAVAEQRQRLQEIEDSSAWRAGGVVQDALASPLRRGPAAVKGLLRTLRQRRRNQSGRTGLVQKTSPQTVAEAESAQTLVYGSAVLPDTRWEQIWQTDDAALLLACIEQHSAPGTVVLRRLTPAVMRPLARIQRLGWTLVWMPQPGAATEHPHLVRHVRQLADEVVDDTVL